MDWITKLFDIEKIPTRVIILAWIISFLLLYLPSEMIRKLGLIEFQKDYGKYFGIIFLVSAGLLIMLLFSWIYNRINGQRLKTKYKSIIKDSILNLDPHEKAVLREYYIQGKNTLKIPMDNPTVSGLITKRILYPVGQYGEMSVVGMLLNFAITETAREHLTFQLLEIPIGEPTDRDIERIRDSRPHWMIRLESNQRLFDSF